MQIQKQISKRKKKNHTFEQQCFKRPGYIAEQET